MKTRNKVLLVLVLLLLLGAVVAGLWWWLKPLDKKNKSGLQVITGDEVVSIFLNDEFLGKSPYLTKDLKPGNYQLRLEPENSHLMTYNTTLNLRKGLLSVVTWKPGVDLSSSGGVIYELEKLEGNQTELSIVSIPDGAIISLDQGEKKFAPLTMSNLDPGAYELEASLPSYETQQHTINIVKGHRLNILIKLAKTDGSDEPAVQKDSETAQPLVLGETTQASASTQATPSATASPSAQAVREKPSTISLSGPQVLIESTNYFVEGKEVLNVRAASSSASPIVGSVDVNQKYPYLNEETLSWLKISFETGAGNQIGWVSKNYATVVE